MSINSVSNDLASTVNFINAQKPIPPTISGYSVAGQDDTALSPAGGQTVQINGTGFLPGATITFDGSAVAVVTFVNANQLTFTSPAKSAGTYTIYVVNADGGTAIYIPGIIYSLLPTWTTSAGTLGSYYETTSISNTVVASGDAPITYSLFSGSLPTGSTLYANGVITGTAPVDSSSTTYSFTIEAIDAQLQGSTRSFSLTINVDAVTWVSPANNTTYTSTANSAIANVALSATDAAGYAVSYSANALPTGLTLTGSNIAGTPTVIADSSTLLTATAATTNRTAVRTINWSITVANDVYFEYNTLLIPGASTTFVDDASTNNFAVSIFGDTKPNNTNPYTPGYYSNLFDGTVDRLVPSANAAFAFGTGAFCIEAWMYNTTLKNYSCLVTTRPDNSNYADAYHIGFDSVGGLSLYVNDTSRAGCPAGTVILNIWQHLVCCRNASGLVSIYINGVRKGTETVTTNFTRNLLGIADFPTTPAEGLIGYISNLRLVKGSSVYDPTQTSITVPTTPLTAIANTSILTCQSNRFIDNSTNNFTLTVFGDTKIQSFQPFTPNTSYSTYGSGYFDGTGDYLLVPTATPLVLSGGVWTIECWCYLTSSSFSTYRILINKRSGSSAASYDLYFNITNGYLAFYNGTGYTSTVVPIINAWNHIAAVYDGTNINLYMNGVRVLQSATTNPDNGGNLYIGADENGSSNYFIGYINDVRILKGTALYSGTTYTVPTVPLTAIANTSLLTLQNNQSVNNSVFLDNSTNNFLVTRNGNTTQGTFSPYGGNWSNYFDGTGDNLSLATATALGTGNTTVEFWFYPTDSSATYRAIYDGRSTVNTDTGYAIFQYGLTIEVYGNGLKVATSASAFTVNNWVYVALVRTSGTCQLYINGVASGSSGTYSANLTSTVRKIGDSVHTLFPFVGYISNLREVTSALYSGTFTPSTTPLTAITNTSLLTCQSPRLIDNSINNFTITKNGDVSVQRFSPFNPSIVTATSYSGYFDGNGDYLTAGTNSSLAPGAGNFTLEFWIYPTSGNTFYNGIYQNYSEGVSRSTAFRINTNNSDPTSLMVQTSASALITTASGVVTLNSWNHVALVRNGSGSNNLVLYVNGVSRGTVTNTTNFSDGYAQIGNNIYNGAGYYWNGYISNLRLVVGTAVYTSTFTPPTSPLTAISGTSLLTLQSPTFIDNSTNNFTISAFGNSQPTQQNPFGFTSATTNGYTVSTIGGSGYFDGTGDYLTINHSTAFNLSGIAFTIEAWIYTTTSSGYRNILTKRPSSAGPSYQIWINITDNKIGIGNATTPQYSNSQIVTNTWNHVAWTYDGSATSKLWINGVLDTTVALSPSADNANPITIGAWGLNGSEYFNGYITDVRIVKGSQVYTTAFIPPATPITAIQNTVLLNNMTSAGIYDSAMMNNLETVGDAKLSTAVSKFGGSSMAFDGTGDSLFQPSNLNYGYGTGDFTIEFWLYLNATTTQSIVNNLTAASGASVAPHIYYANASGIRYYVNSADRITGSALSTGVWYHIAVCRSGSSTKMFINGTQTGSTYTDTNNYGTSNPLGVGDYAVPQTGTFTLNGYIDDLRITKGYARYTSNFTPPTSAFPIY